MLTRRQTAMLAIGLPLFPIGARAEEQPTSTDSLIKGAMEQLRGPPLVYRQYATFSFYVQLVERYSKLGRDDISAAERTADLVLKSIQESFAKFEPYYAAQISSELEERYNKSRTELWAFLTIVGIGATSPAGAIIEQALIAMILFYAGATKVTKIADLNWCVYPFCFKRPA